MYEKPLVGDQYVDLTALLPQRLTISDLADPALWSHEETAKDYALAEQIKAEHHREMTPKEKEQMVWAKAWEALICTEITLGEWLGANTRATFTTDYDDLFHGADGVIEIGLEESLPTPTPVYSRLGFDATFSEEGLVRKLQKIKAKIDRSELAQVKYYKSPHTGEKRTLSRIPLVILFASKTTIQEWVLAKQQETLTEERKQYMQLFVLEQITYQLLATLAYIRSSRCSLSKSKKEGLLERFQRLVDDLIINIQAVLPTKVDTTVLDRNPDLQKTRAKVNHLFAFSYEIMPERYRYALDMIMDFERIEMVEQALPEVTANTAQAAEAIPFQSLLAEIRRTFNSRISASRVLRYAQDALQDMQKKGLKENISYKAEGPLLRRLFLTPGIADAVRGRFQNIAKIPQVEKGWKTNKQVYEFLTKELGLAIKPESVDRLARSLQEDTNDIKPLQTTDSRIWDHYSPTLVQRVITHAQQEKNQKVNKKLFHFKRAGNQSWKSQKNTKEK